MTGKLHYILAAIFQVFWYLVIFRLSENLIFSVFVVFVILAFIYCQKNMAKYKTWISVLGLGLLLEVLFVYLGLLTYSSNFALGLSLDLILLWIFLSFVISFAMDFFLTKNKFLVFAIALVGAFSSYKMAEVNSLAKFTSVYSLVLFSMCWSIVFLLQLELVKRLRSTT